MGTPCTSSSASPPRPGFAAVTIAFVGVEVFNADLAAGPPQQAAREAYTHMAELLAAIAGEAS